MFLICTRVFRSLKRVAVAWFLLGQVTYLPQFCIIIKVNEITIGRNMNKIQILKYIMTSILCVSLVACGGNQVSVPTPDSSSQLPAISFPEKIPQPSAGTGSVVVTITPSKPEDLIGLEVFLGEAIKVEDYTGGFLDPSKAPHSFIENSTGRAYFPDIEPGTYTLIVYEVAMGGIAYQDESGNVMTFEVEPDQILDLGALAVTLP